MNLLCPFPGTPCFDPANPIANISSEEADKFLYFGRNYATGFFPPIGGGGFYGAVSYPDLSGASGDGILYPDFGGRREDGPYWYSFYCGVTCVSDVSQQDADDCAFNLAQDCMSLNWPQWPAGGGDPYCMALRGAALAALAEGKFATYLLYLTLYIQACPEEVRVTSSPRQLVSSDAQFCTAYCEDGTPYTFTLVANHFRVIVNNATPDAIASAQTYVNNLAYQVACQRTALRRLCLSSASKTRGCTGGVPFESIVNSSAANPPLTYSIADGGLPPGLDLDQDGLRARFWGYPTTIGTYPFILRVVDNQGNVVDKSFSLQIMGFTNADPPQGIVGTAYNHTFTAGGGNGAYSYALTGGALPDGLSMAGNGVVTGTPTTEQISTFEVTVTDASGETCAHDYGMTIGTPCPAIVDQIFVGTTVVRSAYDPSRRHLWVAEVASANGGIWVYDTTTNAIVTSFNVAVGQGQIVDMIYVPTGYGVPANDDCIYVTTVAAAPNTKFYRIDAGTYAVTLLNTGNLAMPGIMALSTANSVVYVLTASAGAARIGIWSLGGSSFTLQVVGAVSDHRELVCASSSGYTFLVGYNFDLFTYEVRQAVGWGLVGTMAIPGGRSIIGSAKGYYDGYSDLVYMVSWDVLTFDYYVDIYQGATAAYIGSYQTRTILAGGIATGFASNADMTAISAGGNVIWLGKTPPTFEICVNPSNPGTGFYGASYDDTKGHFYINQFGGFVIEME